MNARSHQPAESDRIPPLVLVEGFLGGGSVALWGKFETFLNYVSEEQIQTEISAPNKEHGPLKKRQVLLVSIGPVSSLHDRACELYYALKGGRVDYGQEHALNHGHDRFGRLHETGLYPGWSSESPLHFLAHSIGGCTVIHLQYLISQGHFGLAAHPDMILSTTSVSSPFRGTQLVYILGADREHSPVVRHLSVGGTLGKLVHIGAFLSSLAPRLPGAGYFPDLHAESRHLTYQDLGITGLLSQLRRSDWADSKDTAPWDMTFLAAEEREAAGWGVPKRLRGGGRRTWYRTYTSQITQSGSLAPPQSSIINPFYHAAKLASSFDFRTLVPTPSFVLDDGSGHVKEKHRANDGVVPIFSQWHPGECSPSHCTHIDTSSNSKSMRSLEPGLFHVRLIPGPADVNHHLSVIPFWLGSETQRAFWRDFGEWLADVDVVSEKAARPEQT